MLRGRAIKRPAHDVIAETNSRMSSASATPAPVDDNTTTSVATDDVTTEKKDEAVAESDVEEAEVTSAPTATGGVDEKSPSLGEDELDWKLEKATKV